MKIVDTKLSGVYIIEPDTFEDDRGSLVKSFNKDFFIKNGLISSFEENYYSISNKNVIRGMHFQKNESDHAKLVYVTHGSILDVVIDLRKNSPTYGQCSSLELSKKNHKIIYMPKGCAHGFLSLEDNSCVIYLQEKARSEKNEDGIHFNSFGMDWRVANPIVSKRDQELQNLSEFDSPFMLNESK
ncbi:MAG: dTDP-4-dehydrorhamnose 3,5-epimerase [Minisyncoccia bacterium]